MPKIETTEEGQAIVTPSLRLAFRQSGDQWTHSIELADLPGFPLVQALLNSDASHPPGLHGPTYQQISFQRRADRCEALLVGQSQKHHFSAVFAVSEQGDGVLIEADVADRRRSPVEGFGCAYVVGARWGDVDIAYKDLILWEVVTISGQGRLSVAAEDTAQLVVEKSSRDATRVRVVSRFRPDSSTQRCAYHWRWSPSGCFD